MRLACLKRLTTVVLLAASVAMQTPVIAAPVLSNTAAIRAVVSGDLTEVRWHSNRGGAVAAGVAAGLLLGAIAGSSSRD
jgi:hypothetical protein